MKPLESGGERTQRVWDPLVRIGHWLLAVAVITSWLTRHAPGQWHEQLGYAALSIVALRVLWGWCGSPHARFNDFVRGPRATLNYARAMFARREPTTAGHNPLGGWMVVTLLVMIGLVCGSGWLYTTDRYWGIEWVEVLHSRLSDALLILIAVHVAGVLYASWRHRENLIAAMVHGRKPVREHARSRRSTGGCE